MNENMQDSLFSEEQLGPEKPATNKSDKKMTREESRKKYLETHQKLMEIADLLRIGIRQQNAKATKSKEKPIAKIKNK